MTCTQCGIPGYVETDSGLCPSCDRAAREQEARGTDVPPCRDEWLCRATTNRVDQEFCANCKARIIARAALVDEVEP